METILLGAVLGVLVLVLLLLWKLYGALAAREEVLRQQAREDADRLRDSLDQKVTLSMGVVSDRLGQVSRGLGSMQSLAQGVGDLKKVLTNVKNRGIWGEMQLGNLLADMLAPDQYGTNVAVRPRSQERVEFAIRLPGRTGEGPVWLPIDAKFPLEDYQRLVEAREAGDGDGETLALKQLELRLKSEARDIRDKYIAPPYSTDFGLLYLPLEGLFAEAVSLPGLVGELQRKYRVTLAGPTTLAALINSLQMGFRTLAVQKQTSQVWRLVAQINNDLGTFQLAVEKAEKKLEEAQNALETVGNRTRILKKHLEQAEKFTQALDNRTKVIRLVIKFLYHLNSYRKLSMKEPSTHDLFLQRVAGSEKQRKMVWNPLGDGGGSNPPGQAVTLEMRLHRSEIRWHHVRSSPVLDIPI